MKNERNKKYQPDITIASQSPRPQNHQRFSNLTALSIKWINRFSFNQSLNNIAVLNYLCLIFNLHSFISILN